MTLMFVFNILAAVKIKVATKPTNQNDKIVNTYLSLCLSLLLVTVSLQERY